VHRLRKSATVTGYNGTVQLVAPPCGRRATARVDHNTMIERWIASLDLSASTRTKAIVLLHGIFCQAKGA
jgi:hypothetical protein